MVAPAKRMATELTRSFPALRVASQVYPDESHGSVVGGALSRAMRFLYGDFGRPTVTLPVAARAEYSGEWTSPAFTIHLKPAGTGVQLALAFSGQILTDTLYAASRDTLFSAGAAASQFVAVRDATGKITALKGRLLGPTMEYVRGKK